jgi:hypothetical protein
MFYCSSEFRTKDIVYKSCDSGSYKPSSEPFRFHLHFKGMPIPRYHQKPVFCNYLSTKYSYIVDCKILQCAVRNAKSDTKSRSCSNSIRQHSSYLGLMPTASGQATVMRSAEPSFRAIPLVSGCRDNLLCDPDSLKEYTDQLRKGGPTAQWANYTGQPTGTKLVKTPSRLLTSDITRTSQRIICWVRCFLPISRF